MAFKCPLDDSAYLAFSLLEYNYGGTNTANEDDDRQHEGGIG